MIVRFFALVATSTTLTLGAMITLAHAQSANVENGADVFRKCRACHLVGETARHAVGPALNNVIGRKAASADGYSYSDNMRELGQGGLIWTDEALDRYIENPKVVAPRGKMAFPGIVDAQDRADVIAYLKTFGRP